MKPQNTYNVMDQSAHTIVINRKGGILLTQRRDVPFWVIPGGHINKKESPKAAAIRELYEETGIKLKKVNLIAKYYAKNGNIKKYLFSGELGNQFPLKKSSEVRNIKWANCGNLPTPISLYDTKKINDFFVFNNKAIIRIDSIDKWAELINQLKNPLTFGWVLFFLIKNQFTTKTFKI